MRDDRHVTTVITTEGRALATFSSVNFRVSVTTHDQNGPEAKDKAHQLIKRIEDTLKGPAGMAAGVDLTRLETSFMTKPKTTYDRDKGVHAPDGYEAVYTVTFTGNKLDGAIALHDALTSIKGVVADTPVFNITNTAELEEKAFGMAWGEARRRFWAQCRILEANQDNFEIIRWEIEERRRGGKGISIEDEDGPKPGQADFILKVKFTFGPKA